MATMNGKTPEVMANEIIGDLNDRELSVSGTSFQKLATVVRYLNRDKIAARGEVWFRKNETNLITDAMETLINAREKAIVDYQAKKELADKNQALNKLVARGIKVEDAYAQVFKG